MKVAFEAPDAGLAHIIKDLLERTQINAEILGEYLQGGVGEIPASGFIRVVVRDEDYLEAKEVIKAWDEAPWDETKWDEAEWDKTEPNEEESKK